MLGSLVKHLSKSTSRAFSTLSQFLKVFILAVTAAILIALLWILRVTAILLWFFGIFTGLLSIQVIYSPMVSPIPLFILQTALILLMAGWVLFVFRKEGKYLWGTLATSGLTAWSISHAALWLISNWKYADLFFGVLPSAIYIVLHITIITRVRSKQIRLAPILAPAESVEA